MPQEPVPCHYHVMAVEINLGIIQTNTGQTTGPKIICFYTTIATPKVTTDIEPYLKNSESNAPQSSIREVLLKMHFVDKLIKILGANDHCPKHPERPVIMRAHLDINALILDNSLIDKKRFSYTAIKFKDEQSYYAYRTNFFYHNLNGKKVKRGNLKEQVSSIIDLIQTKPGHLKPREMAHSA